MSVLDHIDYREFLAEWFAEKKQESPWYSYKVFGKGVDLDASQVYRILSGKLHISKAAQPRFCRYLELTSSESEYFGLLIAFSKSKSDSESKILFNKILSLRGTRSKLLKEEQLRLYEEWYHPVIRSLVNIIEVSDNHELIAKSIIPNIGINQVKKSLALLSELNLIKKNAQGIWRACEPSVITPGDFYSVMVRKYLSDSIGLAQKCIELFDKDQRDVNVINLGVDESAFEDCKLILEESRRQIKQRLEHVRQPDRIMRLTQALFPIANIEVKHD